jgi:predicted DNA-binding transcriptional regulator AlpA
MRTVPNRIVLNTKDIMLITGKSERTSRRLLKEIRRSARNTRVSFVSLEQFCSFTGMTREEVIPYLQ